MAAHQITFRGQTTSGTAGVPVDKGVRTNLFRITTPTKGFDQYDGMSTAHSQAFIAKLIHATNSL